VSDLSGQKFARNSENLALIFYCYTGLRFIIFAASILKICICNVNRFLVFTVNKEHTPKDQIFILKRDKNYKNSKFTTD